MTERERERDSIGSYVGHGWSDQRRAKIQSFSRVQRERERPIPKQPKVKIGLFILNKKKVQEEGEDFLYGSSGD